MAVRTRPQSKRQKKPTGAGASRVRDDVKGERRQDGTFAKGASGNPGGLSRQHRELRAAFLEDVPTAIATVRGWLRSKDFRKQRVGVETILLRGIGKPGKASELPDVEDVPEPAPEACNTVALLSQVRTMLARGVTSMSRRQEAGELGLEDVATLGDLGRTLGELLKVEREVARASNFAALSVDELLELAFQHAPVDVLRGALAKREAQDAGAAPVGKEGSE